MGAPCGKTLFCPSRGSCPTHYNPDGSRKNPYPRHAKPEPSAQTQPAAQTQPTAKPQPAAKPRHDQPTRGNGGGIRAPRLKRTSQAGKTPAPTISRVEKPVKKISKKELLATAERFANKINQLLAFTGTSVAENDGEITIKIQTTPPTTPLTPSTTASPVAPPPSFSIIQSIETSPTPPSSQLSTKDTIIVSSSPPRHRSTSISTTPSRRQRRTSGPGVAIPKDGIKKIAKKSTTKTYRTKEVEKYFL